MDTTSITPVLLSSEEAARYLGYSKEWLDMRRRAGTGPKHVQIGAGFRFRKGDLDEWIESRVVDPKSPKRKRKVRP